MSHTSAEILLPVISVGSIRNALLARPLASMAFAWALALVLTLHGMSAAASGASGTLHTHVASTSSTTLVDLRRLFATAQFAAPTVATEWQHMVSHAFPQRHFHAASDASVELRPDPASPRHEDKPDLPSLSFVAIVTNAADWMCVAPDGAFACAPSWSPTVGRAMRLERPPRRT